MLSMTAYGYAERLTDDFLLTVEIKSYNNRFLEIVHTMPNSLSRFEQAIDEKIKQVASRGRVELSVRLKQINVDLNLHVDEGVLAQYFQAYEKIAKLTETDTKASLSDYISADGVIVSIRDTEVSQYEKPLMELVDQALTEFRGAKEREGEATKADLLHLAKQLETGLETVVTFADSLETKLKENLITRFTEMLGSNGYDENRFLQEVAILLSKYSVNEEIVRLQTHIGALRELLDSAEPVGKRLDFLSQEMNREINTIGSKSILVEINQQVVNMKDSLENIREQVRNIE